MKSILETKNSLWKVIGILSLVVLMGGFVGTSASQADTYMGPVQLPEISSGSGGVWTYATNYGWSAVLYYDGSFTGFAGMGFFGEDITKAHLSGNIIYTPCGGDFCATSGSGTLEVKTSADQLAATYNVNFTDPQIATPGGALFTNTTWLSTAVTLASVESGFTNFSLPTTNQVDWGDAWSSSPFTSANFNTFGSGLDSWTFTALGGGTVGQNFEQPAGPGVPELPMGLMMPLLGALALGMLWMRRRFALVS